MNWILLDLDYKKLEEKKKITIFTHTQTHTKIFKHSIKLIVCFDQSFIAAFAAFREIIPNIIKNDNND